MNMRKAAAAAFGAALLGAGTSAVVAAPAHGVLSSNSTGTAKNVNKGSGGTSSAFCEDCSAEIDATLAATKTAGTHQGNGHIKQTVANHVKSGPANGTTHGSAKSGGQSFRIK